MRHISDEQRRTRLGLRHRLVPSERAESPVDIADSLVALHATDAATVFLSLGARLQEPGVDIVERALYEEVGLVRMLSMRRTIFAVSTGLAPYVDASTARAIAAKERTTLLRHLEEDGQGLDERWLTEAEQAVLAVLARRGSATGLQLSSDVPVLKTKITIFPGTRQETVQGLATRVIRVLAADSRIRRDRPHGSWTSSQFRWAVGEPWPSLPAAEARAEIARRWLLAYGPATEADLKWWTGWTLGDVRKALASAGAEEVRLDTGTGYTAPGDQESESTPEPWAALLPSLDPSAMGWTDRGFYLNSDHRAAIFDRAGNIGPSVWWNGQIVGGWAQRKDGEIVWRLLSDPGSEATTALEAEAARLSGWVGETRITPRFRTPLERELTA